MDIVYICRAGENEELRYSIRSVVKNLPHQNIWVIGNKPSWYNGNFVSVKDSGNKFENIKACIRTASDIEMISDDFILMNDDFFLLNKIDSLPTYHGGFLKDKVVHREQINPTFYYTKLLRKTLELLNKLGYENPTDYEVHMPMTMNKEKAKIALSHKYLERSVYGNLFAIGGEKVKDVKVYSGDKMPSYDYLNNDFPFVSTTDGSFRQLYATTLRDMFPDPSVYED